jgi:hypothetical protein
VITLFAGNTTIAEAQDLLAALYSTSSSMRWLMFCAMKGADLIGLRSVHACRRSGQHGPRDRGSG